MHWTGTSAAGSNFNPRSSCEERHPVRLRAMAAMVFQSTLLMRGATQDRCRLIGPAQDFNPRSSCEERLVIPHVAGKGVIFQSTLLMRGATPRHQRQMQAVAFQSTLLMRGATCHSLRCVITSCNFNPRSSCEERRLRCRHTKSITNFNPRSSCEERRLWQVLEERP